MTEPTFEVLTGADPATGALPEPTAAWVQGQLQTYGDGRYLQIGDAAEISDDVTASLIADPDSDTSAALNATYATIADPTLTGVPEAPNALPGARTPQLATAQLVADSIPEAPVAPWLIAPPASTFAASAAATWYAANAATFMRFSLTSKRTFRYVNIRVGVQSGNIQVGVARVRPGTGTTTIDIERVAHSGVIACPAVNDQRVDLGYFTLTPGEYVLFLWCDNTTAQFTHGLATGVTASRLTYSSTGLGSGLGSTVVSTGTTTRWVAGLTLEAGYLPVSLLGDSITANDASGVGAAGAWFSNADQQTGYRFYPITNNGSAGERSDQILTRAAAAFSGKRYAVIVAGTNDIGQDVPAATIITNLEDILDAAVSAGLQAFAIGTIPPRAEDTMGTPLSAQQKADLKAVNAWIRANYTNWPGCVLMDWSWALSDGTDESAPLAANFSDYIHPNATGSAIMSAFVRKATRDWV